MSDGSNLRLWGVGGGVMVWTPAAFLETRDLSPQSEHFKHHGSSTCSPWLFAFYPPAGSTKVNTVM